MGTKTRTLAIAAALAATAALFAAPAQAGTSFSLSIGGGVPYGGYVYSQPGYVYSQPYVYTQPSYVYTQPSYIYYDNGHRHHGHDAVPDDAVDRTRAVTPSGRRLGTATRGVDHR